MRQSGRSFTNAMVNLILLVGAAKNDSGISVGKITQADERVSRS